MYVIIVISVIILTLLPIAARSVICVPRNEVRMKICTDNSRKALGTGIRLVVPFMEHIQQVVTIRYGRRCRTEKIFLGKQAWKIPEIQTVTGSGMTAAITATVHFQISNPYLATPEKGKYMPERLTELAKKAIETAAQQTDAKTLVGDHEKMERSILEILAPAAWENGLNVTAVQYLAVIRYPWPVNSEKHNNQH